MCHEVKEWNLFNAGTQGFANISLSWKMNFKASSYGRNSRAISAVILSPGHVVRFFFIKYRKTLWSKKLKTVLFSYVSVSRVSSTENKSSHQSRFYSDCHLIYTKNGGCRSRLNLRTGQRIYIIHQCFTGLETFRNRKFLKFHL